MYRQLQLNYNELLTLFDLIDACHRVLKESDFTERVYPYLRQMLPHEKFACGIGATPENYVIRCLNINFPDDYLNRIITPDGRLLSPVARTWLDKKAPQYFDLTDFPIESPCETGWVTAVRDFGLRNIVAHGMSDIKNKAASYFSLADLPQWGERESSLLEVLVPHLHVALMNASPEDSGTRKTVKLSEREQAVLRWIRAGKSNDEIGVILEISRWTVKTHVKNIMGKLKVSTRAQAVAKAMELGIL